MMIQVLRLSALIVLCSLYAQAQPPRAKEENATSDYLSALQQASSTAQTTAEDREAAKELMLDQCTLRVKSALKYEEWLLTRVQEFISSYPEQVQADKMNQEIADKKAALAKQCGESQELGADLKCVPKAK